jgi:hypothetical protein
MLLLVTTCNSGRHPFVLCYNKHMNNVTVSIPTSDVGAFVAYLEAAGVPTRVHSSLVHNGYQAQWDGHWMAIVWNKNNRHYAVDKRMIDLVNQFKLQHTSDNC